MGTIRTRLNRLQAQLMLEDAVTPVVIYFADGSYSVSAQRLADKAALGAYLGGHQVIVYIPDNGRS